MQGLIKIEKGIPITAKTGARQEVAIALVEMVKGDSFLIPTNRVPFVHHEAKRLKVTIVTRRDKKTPEMKLSRVWRIE